MILLCLFFLSFLTLTAPVAINVSSIEKKQVGHYALCFIEEIIATRVWDDILLINSDRTVIFA